MVQEASMKEVPIIPGFEELDVGTHMWGREGREKSLPRLIPHVHLHDTEMRI